MIKGAHTSSAAIGVDEVNNALNKAHTAKPDALCCLARLN
jgi:hypothetical protein